MQKSSAWDRHVALLTSSVVSGGAILNLPAQTEGPAHAKSSILSQKGLSMRLPEANTLVEAVMDGKVHRDYLTVGGAQYLVTTVTEAAYYGKCTSSSAASGIIAVKTRRVLVLATYTEPVVAAEAIPYVHRFADELDAKIGELV